MAIFVVASSGRNRFQVLRDFIRVGPEYQSEVLANKIKGDLERQEPAKRVKGDKAPGPDLTALA